MICPSCRAIARTCAMSGPLTLYCTGHPTGGPSSSGETRATTLGSCSASSFSSLACSRSRAATSLAMIDDLRKEVVGQLDVERKVEADCAASDIGAPTRDVGIALEHGVEFGRGRIAGEDRGVLRQGEIDDEFGAVGCREKLPRHVGQRQKRATKQPSVTAMVSQRTRIAPTRIERKIRSTIPGSVGSRLVAAS